MRIRHDNRAYLTDTNAVESVVMADNIITGSYYYAVVMGDGWIACDGRYNHGYYDNWAIDTGDPWSDIRFRSRSEY